MLRALQLGRWLIAAFGLDLTQDVLEPVAEVRGILAAGHCSTVARLFEGVDQATHGGLDRALHPIG